MWKANACSHARCQARRPARLAEEASIMPDVDVASPGAHAYTSNEAAFYELVRVVPHDLSVLAGAWL